MGEPLPLPPSEQALIVNALRDARTTTHDIIHALQNPKKSVEDYAHLALNFDRLKTFFGVVFENSKNPYKIFAHIRSYSGVLL